MASLEEKVRRAMELDDNAPWSNGAAPVGDGNPVTDEQPNVGHLAESDARTASEQAGLGEMSTGEDKEQVKPNFKANGEEARGKAPGKLVTSEQQASPQEPVSATSATSSLSAMSLNDQSNLQDEELSSTEKNGSSTPLQQRKTTRRSSTPSSTGLYDRAMRAKAEQQRKRDEAIKNENSFNPTLISSKKLRNRTNTPGRNRHEVLYQKASARQAATPTRELKECTFTPQTNKRKTPKQESSPASRAERLYADAKLLEKKRKDKAEQIRREQENFTFKPQITARARSIRPASPNPTSRTTELHKQYQGKAERLSAAKEALETKDCTFKPKINERRSSSGSAPAPVGTVQDRLAEYHKQLEAKREALRLKALEEEKKELTFQPNISRRPQTPTRTGRGPAADTIHNRLYEEASSREVNQNTEEDDTKEVANKVRPNSASTQRLSTPKMAHEAANQAAGAEDLRECTFKPNAKKCCAISANGTATSIGERSSQPLWERLHKESKGIKERRETLMMQKEMDECSFKPNINRSPTSEDQKKKKSSSQKPIWDRLNSDARKKKLDELEKAKADLELASCTFKPQISNSGQTSATTPAAKTPIWERLSTPNTNSSKRRASLGNLEDTELHSAEKPKAAKSKPLRKSLATPLTKQAKATAPAKVVATPDAKPINASKNAASLSYLDRVKDSAKKPQLKPTHVSGSSSPVQSKGEEAPHAASPVSPVMIEAETETETENQTEDQIRGEAKDDNVAENLFSDGGNQGVATSQVPAETSAVVKEEEVAPVVLPTKRESRPTTGTNDFNALESRIAEIMATQEL